MILFFFFYYVTLHSCTTKEDAVETWPVGQVQHRLEELAVQQRCAFRHAKKYTTKDGTQGELYHCHQGPKVASDDTYIYVYRSPLVRAPDV